MAASTSFAFNYRFDIQEVSTHSVAESYMVSNAHLNNHGEVVYFLSGNDPRTEYWNGTTSVALAMPQSSVAGFNDAGDVIGVQYNSSPNFIEVRKHSISDLAASSTVLHSFYFGAVSTAWVTLSNFTQSGYMGINEGWFSWGGGSGSGSQGYDQAYVISPSGGTVVGATQVGAVSESGISIQRNSATGMRGRVDGFQWTPLPGCQGGFFSSDGTEYLYYSTHILRTDPSGVQTNLPRYILDKVNNLGWGINYRSVTAINEGFVGNINDLLSNSTSGYAIHDLVDINESGQLLAVATKNGRYSLVRLNPTTVPEPATILGLMSASLFFARRKRRG